MVYSLTPSLTYITEDHYVCDEKGHRATTNSGSYIKVPKDYLKYYTIVKNK